MEPLEQKLTQIEPMPEAMRARVLARVRTELPKAPSKHRWRLEVAAVIGAVLLLTAAIGGVLLWSGNTELPVIAARASVLAMGGLICAFAATVAIAPRARRGQIIALLGFLAASVALVLVRHGSAEGSSPEWVCTATHVGVGAVPLLMGLVSLRRAGGRLFAGLALGVSAGTTGAMVGELACGRDATHVLLFHVPAWAAMVALGGLLSLVLRPRSHAP